MGSFKISNEAVNLLEDLPPELSKLYVCLRKIMDYKTGISGETYAISDDFFRDRLSYTKRQGRSAYCPHMKEVYRWLKNLEKEGLIKIYPNYVFKLLLEECDNDKNEPENLGSNKQVQNKWTEVAPMWTRSGQNYPQDNSLKINKKQGDSKISGQEVDNMFLEVAATSGISVIPLDTNINNKTSLPLDTLALSKKQKAPKEIVYDEEFLKIWAAFPGRAGKKRKKAHALKSWKLHLLHVFADQMLDDIAWSKENDEQWKNGYPPDLVTYLNQRQWESDRVSSQSSLEDRYQRIMTKLNAEKGK